MKKSMLFNLILSLFILLAVTSNAQQNVSDSSNYIVIANADNFKTLDDILKLPQFSNKVVFIDLWGYGCASCIAEFKYIKSLKERFTDGGVEYLYIYLAKNPESLYWMKKEMYEYNLTGTHVFANLLPNLTIFHGDWNKWFMERRVITNKDEFAIPRYMIIDKHGKMAVFNAARPSQKQILYSQINRVLRN
jgi:thiol-disulfide isomerase/thioredoxin